MSLDNIVAGRQNFFCVLILKFVKIANSDFGAGNRESYHKSAGAKKTEEKISNKKNDKKKTKLN